MRTHMLVGEKIKRADSGGIGALSISSVEAALTLSLLSKKQANKFNKSLKKIIIITSELQSKRMRLNLTVDDRLVMFSLFRGLGLNVIVRRCLQR